MSFYSTLVDFTNNKLFSPNMTSMCFVVFQELQEREAALREREQTLGQLQGNSTMS